MTGTTELRDPAEARRFLAQGLWLQRVASPDPESVRPALEWALELAGAGDPLPPVGFVADAGRIVLGRGREWGHGREAVDVPGWAAGEARAYEDLVLGKLDADGSVSRAADALARYKGRDRSRGLAFVLDQFRRRAGFAGVLVNPAIIKAAHGRTAESVLAEGWSSLAEGGPMPLLVDLYASLVAAARDAADVLGPEDVFELEHGTALASFGQRVALRQVLQAAAEFEAGLARERPRPSSRRAETPTRVLDEDTYPVGGFSSISTRGSIESLLHSQLAYIEPDERPDLFDIKYVRDELLYYARDENQFLRRRRTFAFALAPDLVQARVKDAELPRQRVVLLLGLLVAAVRKLTDWLGDDALSFEFLFLHDDGDPAEPLDAERALVEMILREAIANGTATTARLPASRLAAHCEARARRSLCHLLLVTMADPVVAVEGTSVARLRLDGPRPAVADDDDPAVPPEAEDAPSVWRAALDWLLPRWL